MKELTFEKTSFISGGAGSEVFRDANAAIAIFGSIAIVIVSATSIYFYRAFTGK